MQDLQLQKLKLKLMSVAASNYAKFKKEKLQEYQIRAEAVYWTLRQIEKYSSK